MKRLEGALEDTVRVRLRADVPVACYLSGGRDSCAVLASRLSSRPLRAYALSFDHADYDERALAEEQAKLSGAEFLPIDVRSEHLARRRAAARGARRGRQVVQDTLRGAALGKTDLYDRERVLSLLGAIPAMDAAARTRVDPALMRITSTCLLHERLGL